MANFLPALTKTLIHEGGFFHNLKTGEVVNRGITLATLRSIGVLKTTGPTLQSDIEFVRSLTEEETADIYEQEYWGPLKLENVTSQDVANKVFDLGVNMGVGGAARLLQISAHVPADGIIGPKTIKAVNDCDPTVLLAEIREHAGERYHEIAAANPLLAGNLKGWLSRLAS